MVGDKEWALDQLRHKRQSLILTLAAMHMLNSPELESLRGKRILLLPTGVVFNPEPHEHKGERYLLELTQVVDERIYKRTDFDYTINQFYLFSRRNFVKESFDTVSTFAGFTNTMRDLEKMPWYNFANVVRNAITHSFRFDLARSVRKLLPISWNGKTIDISMDRTEIKQDMLDALTIMDLYNEILEFVKAH